MGLFKRKAEPEGEPTIVVLEVGGGEPDTPKFCYTLGPDADVVGRDEACSIQVLDPEISREHISIYFEVKAGGFVAADAGSRNGTFLNGRRLEQPTRLQEGDVLEAGNSRMIFTSKQFEDQMSAIHHFKRHGERYRGTIPGGRDGDPDA